VLRGVEADLVERAAVALDLNCLPDQVEVNLGSESGLQLLWPSLESFEVLADRSIAVSLPAHALGIEATRRGQRQRLALKRLALLDTRPRRSSRTLRRSSRRSGGQSRSYGNGLQLKCIEKNPSLFGQLADHHLPVAPTPH
jgi:hypothetical protein